MSPSLAAGCDPFHLSGLIDGYVLLKHFQNIVLYIRAVASMVVCERVLGPPPRIAGRSLLESGPYRRLAVSNLIGAHENAPSRLFRGPPVGDLGKRFRTLRQPRRGLCEFLPSSDHAITRAWVLFDYACPPTDAFRRDQDRSQSCERGENNVVTP